MLGTVIRDAAEIALHDVEIDDQSGRVQILSGDHLKRILSLSGLPPEGAGTGAFGSGAGAAGVV